MPPSTALPASCASATTPKPMRSATCTPRPLHGAQEASLSCLATPSQTLSSQLYTPGHTNPGQHRTLRPQHITHVGRADVYACHCYAPTGSCCCARTASCAPSWRSIWSPAGRPGQRQGVRGQGRAQWGRPPDRGRARAAAAPPWRRASCGRRACCRWVRGQGGRRGEVAQRVWTSSVLQRLLGSWVKPLHL